MDIKFRGLTPANFCIGNRQVQRIYKGYNLIWENVGYTPPEIVEEYFIEYIDHEMIYDFGKDVLRIEQNVGRDYYGEYINSTKIYFDSPLTEIPNGCFENYLSLELCFIPNTVEVIGSNAFKGTSISNIYIPDSVTTIGGNAFSETYIKSLRFPNNLSQIPVEVIANGYNLQEVIIGTSVELINDYAFYNCFSLSKIISYNMTAPELREGVFMDIATDGVLYINEGAVGYEAWLEQLPAGWRIEYIKQYHYIQNTLNNHLYYNIPFDRVRITIPQNVSLAGAACGANLSDSSGNTGWHWNWIGVFSDSRGALIHDNSEIITVPQMTQIDTNTFEYCFSQDVFITSFEENCTIFDYVQFNFHDEIPEINDSEIPEDAPRLFYRTNNGEALTLPSDWNGYVITHDFNGLEGTVYFNYPIESIPRNAFLRQALSYIELPESVYIIEQGGLGNTFIEELDLTNIQSIGDYGCCDIEGLYKVTLGANLTMLNAWSFVDCEQLQEIVCYAVDVPVISNNVWNNVGVGGRLYVPAESVEAYREAWVDDIDSEDNDKLHGWEVIGI